MSSKDVAARLIEDMEQEAPAGDSYVPSSVVRVWIERLRALTFETPTGEWQPIETAPKDGTVVLAWRFYPVVVRWVDDSEYPWESVTLGGHFAFTGNGYKAADPQLTHWQPLPAAPAGDEPGEPSEWHQVSPENYWREVWHHSHECRSGPMKRLEERLEIEDGSKLRLFECASCGTRLFAGLDARRMVVWRAEPGGGE